MATKRFSGAPIIAGSIVIVGILIVITLVVLLRDDGSTTAEPSTSPAASSQPEPSESKRPRSPRPSPSSEPSPSPSSKPSPSPTPTLPPPNNDVIRATVSRAANRDRHGEVTHVGQVRLYHTDKQTCPTRSGATVNVRYDSDPKFGLFYLCQRGERWVVTAGPLYGE